MFLLSAKANTKEQHEKMQIYTYESDMLWNAFKLYDFADYSGPGTSRMEQNTRDRKEEKIEACSP